MRRSSAWVALVWMILATAPARANDTPQVLPFAQDWSDTELIKTDGDWSAVPGFVGFRGDDGDPATPEGFGCSTGPMDEAAPFVHANIATDPDDAPEGVAEFQAAGMNPVVALSGDQTADFPSLRLTLTTRFRVDIDVSYVLRDLEDVNTTPLKCVSLQYRVGTSGAYQTVEGSMPSRDGAGAETVVAARLPDDAENEPVVQLRWVTQNARGEDEYVGIDDIVVTGRVPDQDSDGVADSADNCVSVPNTDQDNWDLDYLGNACDPDDDDDMTPDEADNCPSIDNRFQENSDGDPHGDACDANDDNDGVLDGSDNCRVVANEDQANADGDASGDACDADDDNDGVGDGPDNCGRAANPSQEDADSDGAGDACDGDDDADGRPDGTDNCRTAANPEQANTDLDPQGDACDVDDDGDGVLDGSDNCPLAGNQTQSNTDGAADGGDVCDADDDDDGIGDARDRCPRQGARTPDGCPATALVVVPAPALSALRVSRATITFTSAAPAKVRFTLARCAKPARKRCRRFKSMKGVFGVSADTGANEAAVPARLRDRPIRPGVYRLTAIAFDAQGRASARVNLVFTLR